MSDPVQVRGPVKMYRRLLTLFPAEFRSAYGEQMLIAFRDRTRDYHRQADFVSLATWYWFAFWDVLESAAREGMETMPQKAMVFLRLGLFVGVLYMLALLTWLEMLFVGGFVQMYLPSLTDSALIRWLPAGLVLAVEVLLLVLAIQRSRNWWWIPTLFGGLRVYSFGAMLLLAGFASASGFGHYGPPVALSGLGLILGLTWWAMARIDGSRLAARMAESRLSQALD